MAGRARTALVAYLLIIAAAAPAARGADHRAPFRDLPAGIEVLYLPAKYGACIPCHPRPVFEDEDFNVDTYFRDTRLGKNLHWMHVFRQPQGTNCSACHRIDEGTGALGYQPGVRFEPRPDGGSCAPACHRPKEYRNAGRPKVQGRS
ncbi:MAG: hypothetical protein ACM3NF_00225 [Gemmatimonadota bacterium]